MLYDLLTARPWKESKAEIKTDAGTFDISASYIDDCEKDNTYTFSKDGTFSFDAGADDCDGDEEDYTGTWSWKENETVLSTVVDGDTDNSKVLEITSTTIKIDAGKISYDLDGDGNDDTEVSLINTYSNK